MVRSFAFVAGAGVLSLLFIGGCASPAPEAPAASGAPASGGVAAMAAPEGEYPTKGKAIAVSGPPPEESGWEAQTVVTGIPNGWGMAWLPDGRLLVTQKGGGISVVQDGSHTPNAITGAPIPAAIGQGGLMDIVVHPDFAQNGYVFFTYSVGNEGANRTALARGTLRGTTVSDLKVLAETNINKSGGQHFGSRVAFLPDKTLLFSIGDGGNPPSAYNGKNIRDFAQDLSTTNGKVLRMDADGKAPADNPFVGKSGADPLIYTYGHRNIQGLAVDAKGRIFANEHGARGGDELNILIPGGNYGWPLATYSNEYSGPAISDKQALPDMVDPIVAWTPCPAPSGLVEYTGSEFPAWRGSLMSGGLAGQDIRRVAVDEKGRVTGQTKLSMGVRIRDVRMGPDGHLYALTDEGRGRIFKIVAKK